jgi:hypothetical protein
MSYQLKVLPRQSLGSGSSGGSESFSWVTLSKDLTALAVVVSGSGGAVVVKTIVAGRRSWVFEDLSVVAFASAAAAVMLNHNGTLLIVIFPTATGNRLCVQTYHRYKTSNTTARWVEDEEVFTPMTTATITSASMDIAARSVVVTTSNGSMFLISRRTESTPTTTTTITATTAAIKQAVIGGGDGRVIVALTATQIILYPSATIIDTLPPTQQRQRIQYEFCSISDNSEVLAVAATSATVSSIVVYLLVTTSSSSPTAARRLITISVSNSCSAMQLSPDGYKIAAVFASSSNPVVKIWSLTAANRQAVIDSSSVDVVIPSSSSLLVVTPPRIFFTNATGRGLLVFYGSTACHITAQQQPPLPPPVLLTAAADKISSSCVQNVDVFSSRLTPTAMKIMLSLRTTFLWKNMTVITEILSSADDAYNVIENAIQDEISISAAPLKLTMLLDDLRSRRGGTVSSATLRASNDKLINLVSANFQIENLFSTFDDTAAAPTATPAVVKAITDGIFPSAFQLL